MSIVDEITPLLEKNNTCVLASVNAEGNPEAATVGFSNDSHLTFLIGMNKSSRKYKNIKASETVALVIGTEGTETLQLEGNAEEVAAGDIQARLDAHFHKLPSAKVFLDIEGQCYFLVRPTWLRYTNYQRQPQTVEVTDFSEGVL